MTDTKQDNGREQTLEIDESSSTPVVSPRHPFFGGWFDRWPGFTTQLPELWAQFTGDAIPVEEFVEDDTLVVRAELPGIDADDDIDIELVDDRLTIRARREERTEEEKERSYRSEFKYGSFERTMMLPAGAEADDIEASYDDGILEVRVPVNPQTSESTKVPISHR